MKLKNFLFAFIAIFSFLFIPSTFNKVEAAVDTCTWTGAVNTDWSNGGNWTVCDNGGVPENGDSLIFPIAALSNAAINDIVGLQVNNINFTSGGITISGTAFSLDGTITAASGGIATINNNIALLSAAELNASAGGSSALVIGGTIDTNGFTLTVDTSGSGVSINGIVSDTGGITKSGTANLNLNGVNTYSGATVINASGGTININNSASLGSSAVATTVNSGGKVSMSGVYTIAESFVLNGGTLENQGNITVSGSITSNGTSYFQQEASGVSLGGGISLPTGSDSLTFDGAGSGNVQVVGTAITGSGGIVKNSSTFMLKLDANSTYSGSTVINAGEVRISVNSALGSTSGTTTINSGGSLTTYGVGSVLTIDENIFVEGAGCSGCLGAIGQSAADHTYTGTITLTGDTTFASSGDHLIFSGVITGTGGITADGAGTVRFSGSSANTYSGIVNVIGSSFELNKTAGVNAITSNIAISSTSTLYNMASDQINDCSIVIVVSGGLWDMGGLSESIGSLSGDGSVDMGSATLTVGSCDYTGEFLGDIAGSGDVTKIGTDVITLSGNNSYTGTTTVSTGTLILNGSNDTTIVNISSGATLGGYGATSATITNDGTLEPGEAGPGLFWNMSGYTQNSGATFSVDLNGATEGSGYDRFTTGGAVLGGNLDVSVGYVPVVGTTYTIITTDGGVTGTFSGLPDGTVFAAGGYYFRINYYSDTVVLTAVNPPLANTGGDVPTGILSLVLTISLLGVATVTNKERIEALVKKAYKKA